MKKRAIRGFVLFAPDDQLIVLNCDIQLITGKTGHGEDDPQAIATGILDIVGRIGVAGAFRGPLEQPFQMLKTQQKGAVEGSIPIHLPKPSLSGSAGAAIRSPPVISDCRGPEGTGSEYNVGTFGRGSSVPILFTKACGGRASLNDALRLSSARGKTWVKRMGCNETRYGRNPAGRCASWP